MVHFLVLSIK